MRRERASQPGRTGSSPSSSPVENRRPPGASAPPLALWLVLRLWAVPENPPQGHCGVSLRLSLERCPLPKCLWPPVPSFLFLSEWRRVPYHLCGPWVVFQMLLNMRLPQGQPGRGLCGSLTERLVIISSNRDKGHRPGNGTGQKASLLSCCGSRGSIELLLLTWTPGYFILCVWLCYAWCLQRPERLLDSLLWNWNYRQW